MLPILLPLLLPPDLAEPSKKGLQVQMVEDALALGVRHAALNIDLARLQASADAPATVAHEHGGRTWRFDRAYLESLDAQIRPLAEHGVLVSLILLSIRSGDEDKDAFLLDARRDAAPPNGICAPNLVGDEARAWHSAALSCMARRWPAAVNWIVGNEVNSHWWWWNMGRAGVDEVVAAYEDCVRLVHAAVAPENPAARVYVSLEHHWNMRCAAGDERQAFPAREFLVKFSGRVRERGEYDWHVAFHPYPEDLFDCRFWEDASAPDADDAPRVTLKNLQVLGRHLAREGRGRRAILSEQGFHRRAGEQGEREQAAALAAAWLAVQREPWIDAFILHRHVDHAHEGGLALGLWTRKPDTVCEPDRPTLMHALFCALGTPEEERALAPYRPLFESPAPAPR